VSFYVDVATYRNSRLVDIAVHNNGATLGAYTFRSESALLLYNNFNRCEQRVIYLDRIQTPLETSLLSTSTLSYKC
jgi:hypothetical protein